MSGLPVCRVAVTAIRGNKFIIFLIDHTEIDVYFVVVYSKL